MSLFFLFVVAARRDLHSFPTRRSSDLWRAAVFGDDDVAEVVARLKHPDTANQILLFTSFEKTAACVRVAAPRSEEHTSELQSQSNLVCRLLLEKKKNIKSQYYYLQVTM